MKIRIEVIDNFKDYRKEVVQAEESKNLSREESEELYKELLKAIKKYSLKEKKNND